MTSGSAPARTGRSCSIYTLGEFHGARVDGQPASLESARELERNVYSTFVSAAAGGTSTVDFDVTSQVQLVDGWYRLDVLKQPTLRPENLEVNVQVPAGWRIAEVLGRDARIDPSDSHRATVARAVTSEYTLGAPGCAGPRAEHPRSAPRRALTWHNLVWDSGRRRACRSGPEWHAGANRTVLDSRYRIVLTTVWSWSRMRRVGRVMGGTYRVA